MTDLLLMMAVTVGLMSGLAVLEHLVLTRRGKRG